MSIKFQVGEGGVVNHAAVTNDEVQIELTPTQMFVELQELIPRIDNGLTFAERIFANPVEAHFNVLWLQTARWVNFEENYNEVEKRFTEAHVSPMKVMCVNKLTQLANDELAIIHSEAMTLGQALDEVAKFAQQQRCIKTPEQKDVLRAILLAERWHPEVKGHISDAAEFEQYWTGTLLECQKAYLTSGKDNKQNLLSKALSIHHQSTHPYHYYNIPLTNCLSKDAEVCTVMCGTVEFLSKPITVLLHLKHTITRSCISEVDFPVRFIFICLGPKSDEVNYVELARVFAVMMTNQIFRSCVYDAGEVEDVTLAMHIFMQDSLMIPMNKYFNVQTLAGMIRHISAYKRETESEDPERRLRDLIPPRALNQMDAQNVSQIERKISSYSLKQLDHIKPSESEFIQPAKKKVDYWKKFRQDFCPPFSDLKKGIKPWAKRMPSDYKDAFTKANFTIVISSVLCMYFVNLSPTITFAALLNTQVDPSYTVTLSMLSVGIYLILFTAFSGQPLAIIGISAPTFIVESALVSVSKSTGVDFQQIRCWTAIYSTMFGIILIGCNVSFAANHIRRSVEEVYNSFIGFFFLLKAVFTMFLLIPSFPKNGTVDDVKLYYQKLAIAGTTLFLAFIMLQFCLLLAKIKRGNYLRRFIRKLLGAVNVPLGMLLITLLERIFFYGCNLPKINIPPSTQIDPSTWAYPPDISKLNDYSKGSPALIHGISFAIGLTLTIIIFTESALNCLTAMKNKAAKSNVFVMDLILLSILFPFISGLTGWPFVSGATVRTISNLVVLAKFDQTRAPGMPHRVIGTVEQRVSGIIVGVLVTLSIFFGSVLSYIPLAALYGMFLYMGAMGLRDLQFFVRVSALLKRRKHWEDWECVRGLPSKQILMFAAIQFVVILILVILNIISDFTVLNYLGIIFPVIIFIYALIREFLLPRCHRLSPYLHQLDPKYKLNPVKTAPRLNSTHRNLSAAHKESANSFASGVNINSHLTTNWFTSDRDSSNDNKGIEIIFVGDGVARKTWAT